MTKDRIIAPSLLAADFGNLRAEIGSVESAGADWLHLDVMDGSFVPPITFGDNMVTLAKSCSSLPLDVHLMINNPDKHLETFAKAGASAITVHQEVCCHLHRSLGEIKRLGCQAGVSINPGTPAESIYNVLEMADLVLVMTVNPGWGGQKFIPATLEKIKKISAEIKQRNLSTKISVDGGINAETAKLCGEAGANIFVAGSYIFSQVDRASAIKSLR